MKVIIPAAGLGSRLRPHTFTQPKALLPIGGKPIIGHIIDQVIGWGGTRFTMIVGHLRDKLEDYLTSNFDFPFEFRQQEKMLGLGHAVLTGLDPDDKELLIILGDTLLETDLSPVVAKGVSAIGVKQVPDARKFGVVQLEGERVVRMIEKSPEPPSNLAIVGIYYIREGAMLGRAIKEVIEQGITVKGEYQLTDALQMMVDWGEPLETFPIGGWFDCGKPDALLETNRWALDKDGSRILGGVVNSTIIPPVFIGEDSVVENSVIGPHVAVGAKSQVRESRVSDSIIGDTVIVEGVTLSASLIGNRCRVKGKSRQLNIGASSEIEL